MNREKFGELITALRKECRDENDNSWTQCRLAEVTNLSEVVIGNIERGRKVNLDSEILLSLAQVFQLTTRERREFFAAAAFLDDMQIARSDHSPQEVLEELMCMVGDLQSPAFITDAYCDIVAANSASIAFYSISPEAISRAPYLPAGYNMLRLLFAQEFKFYEIIGDQWLDYARKNISFFRAVSLQYRHTEYFSHLLKALKDLRGGKHRTFRDYWATIDYDDDYYFENEHLRYEHPILGSLNYFTPTFTVLTSAGELFSNQYLPGDSRTAHVFADLVSQVGTKVHRFAAWPDKLIEHSTSSSGRTNRPGAL
jgi:transcriptional regulator with XRE-family HTH domain